MRSTTIILAFAIILLGGCHIGRPNYSLSKSDSERSIDQLWRDGYGFNNPNIDRQKRGLRPVNFDGRTTDANIGERIVGRVVSFAAFELIFAHQTC